MNVAIAILAAVASSIPGSSPSRPNVVLITLDTCRADRIGCYGFPLARTPAVDTLAAEGVRFTNATTTAPVTLPAHASIMTGLLPPAHGVRDNGAYALHDDYVTLAETLKARGYDTAAFVSAMVLNRRYNLAQGFDHYDDDLWAEDEPRLFMIRDRPAPATASRAVKWLDDRSHEEEMQPFFLWAHFFDPHQPYEPRYRDRHLLPTPYDAEIAQADEGVGMLLERLRATRDIDDTVIVLTADHGESLGEHGEKTHAVFIYDATVRVPLIIRYPPLFPSGRTYDGPVRIIDIMPTVLAAIGGTLDAPVQGINLLPALEGIRPPPDLPQYAESLVSEVGFGMAPLYGVRHNGWKWIRAPKPELYHLSNDPGERKNLYLPGSEQSAALDEKLQSLLDDSQRFAKNAKSNPLDQETLEMLRALGYLAPTDRVRSADGMDPKDGLPLYEKLETARHAAQRGDYAASERVLKELLESAPRHITAWNVLGLVLTRQAKFGEAEQAYRESLEIDPSQARVLHMLAVLAFRQGKRDDAEKLGDRVLALAPRMVETMSLLGFLAAQKGDTSAAERWYKRALDEDPASPRFNQAYADLYFMSKDFANAQRRYEKVLDSTPNHFVALIQAGLSAAHQKKWDAALAHYRRAQELRPDSWMPPYNIACVHAQRGGSDEALAALKAALDKAPDHVNVAGLIESDSDFDPLRELQLYRQLVQSKTETPPP